MVIPHGFILFISQRTVITNACLVVIVTHGVYWLLSFHSQPGKQDEHTAGNYGFSKLGEILDGFVKVLYIYRSVKQDWLTQM